MHTREALTQLVKNLPVVQETWVWSHGGKDPLEKEMATHSSILDGKSHWQRSLLSCSPRGHKESGMTEQLTLYFFLHLFLSREANFLFTCSSVQFSCSVMSDSLQPHQPQHPRPHCSPPTPRVYPISGPLSQWFHPTISTSVIPFSSRPQSFPASGSFQMSQLSASSLSFNISPSNEHSTDLL